MAGRYAERGAMKQNYYNGIAGIAYNVLNLPEKIRFMSGHGIQYSYDASGTKHKAVYQTVRSSVNIPLGTTAYTPNASDVTSILTTDYCSNGHIVYENNSLKRILNPEGYAVKQSDGTYKYFYYAKDHLGNNRAVFISGAPTMFSPQQEINYYPFGMPYTVTWASKDGLYPETQPYKFGGKEYDEMYGLNWHDFGARYYNGIVPMFMTMDPLCEKHPNISPYAYAGDNPVNNVDPTGMDWYRHDESGAVIWVEGNESSITRYDQTYNNIGETYSSTTGNTTYNYTQNDITSIDYTTPTTFQAQTTGTGCKVAADAMVTSSGANPSPGRQGEILMADHDANGVATTATANVASGINRIETEIVDNGHAITVGVDYKPKQVNNLSSSGGDGMTDHFVAVVGMNVNVQTGTTSYRFYDPGSRTNGNNAANTMSLQGGFLQGRTAFTVGGQQQPFKVTTIRRNR